jgi:ABC-type multidrug transport system fused ATPase/permease subunit
MERYSDAAYQFFLDNKQGKLTYDALIAPARVSILMQRIPQLGADLFKLMAIGVLLLSTFPVATLALGVVGLGYALITRYLSKRISYNTGKGRAVASTEQATIANEFLSGIRQITIFCTKKYWLQRFERYNRAYRDLYIKDGVWQVVPKSLMEPVALFLMLGFVVISRHNAPDSFANDLPMMGIFVVALVQLLPSLNNLGRGRMDVLSSMADCELIYHALTEPVPNRKEGGRVFRSLRGAIVFRGVSVAYRGRDTILKGLAITFEQGKATAIVGPSGVGKTTIINLMLGFFEPTEGQILIDDIPLQEYRLETWLERVGVVTQDPFIYHAAITDNITFGRTGYSRQSIERAAEIANAHKFISELPQAYETIVGERGMKLSGGEQQRLAIARAVLSDPDILIFDEATSSLDTLSERIVQEAIEKISRDRTVIIIAHRLSTVKHADKIVVLDQGRIVEEGNHQELLAGRGRYFELVTSPTEREFIDFGHRGI